MKGGVASRTRSKDAYSKSMKEVLADLETKNSVKLVKIITPPNSISDYKGTNVCTEELKCGHHCNGVRGEKNHIKCIKCNSNVRLLNC